LSGGAQPGCRAVAGYLFGLSGELAFKATMRDTRYHSLRDADPSFIDFDPGRIPDQLTQAFYEQTYRTFLSGVETAMSFGDTVSGFKA
jgi:hypothetical protein